MWHVFVTVLHGAKGHENATFHHNSTGKSPSKSHTNFRYPSKKHQQKQEKLPKIHSEYFLNSEKSKTKSATRPGVRSNQYEPLFRRRKSNHRDVSRRSPVKSVPCAGQTWFPPKSPRHPARLHSYALPERPSHRDDLSVLRR